MMKRKTSMSDSRLDKAMDILKKLSGDDRELAVGMIEKIGKAAGIEGEIASQMKPIDGIDAWVTKLRSERRTEPTIKTYSFLARQFLTEHPNPSKQEIHQHITERLDQGISYASVENTRKALRSLFKFLKEEGLIAEDPTEGLKHIKVLTIQKSLPTADDIDRVYTIGYARSNDADKMRMVLTILVNTGLRITECVSIRKDCVNLDAQEITVIGKGIKKRTVPLLGKALQDLKSYMAKHPSDSPFLFPGDTKTGYAEIYNIQKTMKRACIRAGVKPFTPHYLRHYFATKMLKDGAKLEVVSRILGHSSVGITGDIYRHVLTEEMHEAVRQFGPQNGKSDT
jgi:integrase/recombinase XerD